MRQSHYPALACTTTSPNLERFFHEMPVPAWVYDRLSLRFLAVNLAALSAYGYSMQEFLSMTIKDIRPAEDISRLVEAANGRLFVEGTQNSIWRHRRKNGQVFDVKISSMLTADGNVSVIATDITEVLNLQERSTPCGRRPEMSAEKALQDQLANEGRKLRSMINNTNDLIWSMDLNLRVVEYNEAFRKRVTRLTGKNVTDITSADFAANAFHHWKEYFTRALAGETVKATYESELNGNTVFEETILNPILDKDEQIRGISCFTRDVTQRKKYIQEIEAQNKRLQDIAWIQSHKVRSHVATLLGLQPLLDCDNPTSPDNRLIMDGIVSELTALDSVIKEINALGCGLQQ